MNMQYRGRFYPSAQNIGRSQCKYFNLAHALWFTKPGKKKTLGRRRREDLLVLACLDWQRQKYPPPPPSCQGTDGRKPATHHKHSFKYTCLEHITRKTHTNQTRNLLSCTRNLSLLIWDLSWSGVMVTSCVAKLHCVKRVATEAPANQITSYEYNPEHHNDLCGIYVPRAFL